MNAIVIVGLIITIPTGEVELLKSTTIVIKKKEQVKNFFLPNGAIINGIIPTTGTITIITAIIAKIVQRKSPIL